MSSPPGNPPAFSERFDDLVYDIGAHVGEDTAYYLKLGYRVVAVEAYPELAAELRRKFSGEIAADRLIVVEAAIAAKAGEIEFHLCDNTILGTAYADIAESNAQNGFVSRKQAVKAVRAADLLREHGVPHYLKSDIEGSDMLVIEALDDFPVRPEFVSVEAGISDRAFLQGQFDALERLGYRSFQFVRQGRHRAIDHPRSHGKHPPHQFDLHSSGPFGDQLPGRWLTKDAVLRRCDRWALYARVLDPQRPLGWFLSKIPRLRRLPLGLPWFDIHARR